MPRGITDLIEGLWKAGAFPADQLRNFDFTNLRTPEHARESPLTLRLENVRNVALLERVVEQLDIEAQKHNLCTSYVAAVPPRGSWLANYFARVSYSCNKQVPVELQDDGSVIALESVESYADRAHRWTGVLLLDNAILTGQSAVRASEALRAAGHYLEGLLTVMSWRIGGEEAYASALHGQQARTLFTALRAAEVGCNLGFLTHEQVSDLQRALDWREKRTFIKA